MKKQNLSDIIYEDLKKRITAGEFRVNSKLPPERILAEHYQVSRVPVREAIKKLEDTGIVTKNPGYDTIVSATPVAFLSQNLTFPVLDETTALQETIHVRRLIEAEAARAAAQLADSEGVERIQQALFESISEIRKLKSNEENHFYEADLKFHRTIVAQSGNPLLLKCLDAMPTILSWHQSWSLSITTPKDEVISYHTLIFESILDKNGDKAYDSMFNHLSRVEELINVNTSLEKNPLLSTSQSFPQK
ncbi:MAG: FadR/GntR family transcriptional regulator [Ruminiclostridium sp.]